MLATWKIKIINLHTSLSTIKYIEHKIMEQNETKKKGNMKCNERNAFCTDINMRVLIPINTQKNH